jgi:hypothetical protein
MSVQPPPPPSISPHQMTLLRVVSTMAWSDGNLAEEEVNVMLDEFSNLFATSASQKESLREELRDYLMQNIPLTELVPHLTNAGQKELVLRLGYQVISSSARTPEEAAINQEEAEAYQQLVSLLGLPQETVKRIEQEASQATISQTGLVSHMTEELRTYMQTQ